MNALPSSAGFGAALQAARDAAGAQHYPEGTLYVVATPIGNLADLSLRAIHALGLVDALACEDTRQGGALLRHLGLHKPLIALHQHNEREASTAVLTRLAAGERVAYASDAGTPAISDPGAVLVREAVAAGYRVATVDLRGADVEILNGIADLRGCRISGEQLAAWATGMAAELGIRVG